MGFLDHSTNNIIIDAVLTDTGRAFLARNDGSFSIVRFALGDDEVDYATVEKYGRTVGKERIEKNTPVMEAQTVGTAALKHKLISVSNPNLTVLPKLTLQTSESTTSDTMSVTTAVGKKEIIVQQSIQNSQTVDSELTDMTFLVRVNNQFLGIAGEPAISVDADNMASYLITRTSKDNTTGAAKLSFNVTTKTITKAQFTVYSSATNVNVISTVVTVTGIQSGAQLSINVNISES